MHLHGRRHDEAHTYDVRPDDCPRCRGVVARTSDDQVKRAVSYEWRRGGPRPRVAELGKEGEGAVQGKALRVDGARCALRMRRGHATVSVRQDTRFVDAQQTRVAKKQGAGFLGWRAASPRVVSIIIRTDAVALMPNNPGWKSRAQ